MLTTELARAMNDIYDVKVTSPLLRCSLCSTHRSRFPAFRRETTVAQQRPLLLPSLQVPDSWVWTPSGGELSWIMGSLGLWFASLVDRDQQLRQWLHGGRPVSFWLTGFFNPQGFLTAMKQEVARTHKKEDWALDDVVYTTDITEFDRPEQIRGPPRGGVYIHGLFLEAAAWSKAERCVVASSRDVCSYTPSLPLSVRDPTPTPRTSHHTHTHSDGVRG